LFTSAFLFFLLYIGVTAFVFWELTCGFLHYRLARTLRITSIGQRRRLKMVTRGMDIDNSLESLVVLLPPPWIGPIVMRKGSPYFTFTCLVFCFCFAFFISLGWKVGVFLILILFVSSCSPVFSFGRRSGKTSLKLLRLRKVFQGHCPFRLAMAVMKLSGKQERIMRNEWGRKLCNIVVLLVYILAAQQCHTT